MCLSLQRPFDFRALIVVHFLVEVVRLLDVVPMDVDEALHKFVQVRRVARVVLLLEPGHGMQQLDVQQPVVVAQRDIPVVIDEGDDAVEFVRFDETVFAVLEKDPDELLGAVLDKCECVVAADAQRVAYEERAVGPVVELFADFLFADVLPVPFGVVQLNGHIAFKSVII